MVRRHQSCYRTYLEAQWRAVLPAGSVWFTGISGGEIKIIISHFLKLGYAPTLAGSGLVLSLFASFLIIKTLLQQASVASLGGIVERAGAGAGAEVLQQVAGHQALLAFHPAHQSK